MAAITVHPEDLPAAQNALLGGRLAREQKALELLRRPEVGHAFLAAIPKVGPRVSPADESVELAEQITAQVEVQARYAGYVRRQEQEIERSRGQSETALPELHRLRSGARVVERGAPEA